MTKKILALALAGTTAFSVFASAMSVNAAPVVLYTAQTLTTTASTPLNSYETTSNGYTQAHYEADLAAYEDSYEFYNGFDFYVSENKLLATPTADDVESGMIYLYDYTFANETAATAYKTAVEAFVTAYEKADAAGKAATWGDGSADVVTEVGGSAKGEALLAALGTTEAAIGTAATGITLQVSQDNADRRKAVIAMEDLKEDLRPATDFDSASDDYDEYAALVARINAISTPFAGVSTSELTWLKARVDAIVGDLYEADTEDADVLVERYTKILDARMAEDYKNSYDFTRFEGDYAEQVAKFDGKNTVTQRENYAAALRTLIFAQKGETAGADKTELESLLTEAASIDAAHGYVESGEAWTTFTTIKALANSVKTQPKKYSYQSTIDAVAELLSEAMAGVGANGSVTDWQWLRLENAVEAAEALQEEDFTATSWKRFKPILARAQKLMDTSNATSKTVEAAAENLEKAIKYTEPAVRTLVPKNVSTADKKALQDALKEAKAALAGMDKNTSGYQMASLTKAIADADALFSDNKQTTLKNTTLISNVSDAKAALDAAMTSAAQPQGWYTTEAGAWMYGEGDGYYVDGWKKIGNFWFHFDANGIAKQNEWMSEGGKWYYFGNSCVAYAGWGKVDGSWYYFDKGNAMCTGWIKLGNTWYYLDPTSGKMVTGWATIGGTSYYFSTEASTLGAMLVSTTTPDGYTVDANGAWVK